MSCSTCNSKGQTEFNGVTITCPSCRGFGHELPKKKEEVPKPVELGKLKTVPAEAFKWNVPGIHRIAAERNIQKRDLFGLNYGGLPLGGVPVGELTMITCSKPRDPGVKTPELRWDYEYMEQKVCDALKIDIQKRIDLLDRGPTSSLKPTVLKASVGNKCWTVWRKSYPEMFRVDEAQVADISVRGNHSDHTKNIRTMYGLIVDRLRLFLPPRFVCGSQEEAQTLCDEINTHCEQNSEAKDWGISVWDAFFEQKEKETA